MKPIGGFFEFEIPKGNSLYHDNAIMLSTGRACLKLILSEIKPSNIFIPFYCCNSIIEAIKQSNIKYKFYSITNDLEIETFPKLKENEYILYINYFGIKTVFVNAIINKYTDNLIIDDTHSYFNKGYENNFSFTSSRKYFGVADGAFLYSPISIKEPKERNTQVSNSHNINRLIKNYQKAFVEYQHYESHINIDICKMSLISEMQLKNIDYLKIIKQRNDNFNILHDAFKDINILNFSKEIRGAFCYPLLLRTSISREQLFESKIFLPTFWLDTIKRHSDFNYIFEKNLSEKLLPLPIDHRYDKQDMLKIIAVIKNIINLFDEENSNS